MSANPRVFPERLTVELLEKHKQISENSKQAKRQAKGEKNYVEL